MFNLPLNEEHQIQNIVGHSATRSYLYSLGLIKGQTFSILEKNTDGFIIKIGDTKIALDSHVAQFIIVAERVLVPR